MPIEERGATLRVTPEERKILCAFLQRLLPGWEKDIAHLYASIAGKARSVKLSPERRREISSMGAVASNAAQKAKREARASEGDAA